MATGAITMSIAISEPGTGSHPKHLKTSAERTGQGYILKGEKTYLTNGPFADVFIVLAVTRQEGARKRYSAFIVPKETSNLHSNGPLDVGFLRPCLHGGIILDGCRVPEHNMIGSPDNAYEIMALPFRNIEDTMVLGPIIGAQEARLHEVGATLREMQLPITEDCTFRLGGISSMLSALHVIALEAAQRLEEGNDPEGLTPLILACRNHALQVHRELDEVVASSGIHASTVYQTLTHDLEHIGRFALQVSRLKQIKLGAELISPATHPRNE
jgi:acyl-CoA dehydrogenase